jgi:carbamoyltransferase
MKVLGYSGFTRDSRSASGRRGFARTGIDFDSLFSFRDGEVPFTRFPLGYLGHDASAALVIDGEVIAAAAEERFTRAKHALNLAGNTLLPRHAMAFSLEQAGLTIDDIDVIAHYCDFPKGAAAARAELLDPWLETEERELVRRAFDMTWAQMLAPSVVERQLAELLDGVSRSVVGVSHHLAHAASAYYPSGFDEALIVTLDGTGELESSLVAVGRARDIDVISTTRLPTSLGSLYLIVTVFLGFRSLGDEYKVMGLAAYGDPVRYRAFFDSLVPRLAEGRYETRIAEPTLRRQILEGLGAPRHGDEPLEERHADIAAALQACLEDTVLHALSHFARTTGQRRLCMAGGVALNCAMNGRIARSGLFDEIFIQPAASDEGCAVGAALSVARASGATPWRHARLGPAWTSEEVREALDAFDGRVHATEEDDIADRAAAEIASGRVVGWFQGRMEFGPRALGGRSILADPRDPGMKDRINDQVKRREPFRPFAPAVLEEVAADWFDMTGLDVSPFMLFTVPVLADKRALIPSVTHVDGTARLQTVSRDDDPLYWRVIAQFGERTGVPVLLNTSFNVRYEPIVCSPADALRCFLETDIDAVALDRFWVEKR